MGILQARIPEWVAIPFFRGSSRPRDQTQFSCIAGGFFTVRATREALWDLYGTCKKYRLLVSPQKHWFRQRWACKSGFWKFGRWFWCNTSSDQRFLDYVNSLPTIQALGLLAAFINAVINISAYLSSYLEFIWKVLLRVCKAQQSLGAMTCCLCCVCAQGRAFPGLPTSGPDRDIHPSVPAPGRSLSDTCCAPKR